MLEEFLRQLWALAMQAGPFATLVAGGIAYYAERNRRLTINSLNRQHTAALEAADARYKDILAKFEKLLEQTLGIDISSDGS